MRYAKDVLDIKRTCEQRLIDKEVHICNSYMHDGKYQSARNRLKGLRQEWLVEYEDLEPRLLYLEGKLAKKEHDDQSMQERVMVLVEKYPDSSFTRMARSLVSDSNFLA